MMYSSKYMHLPVLEDERISSTIKEDFKDIRYPDHNDFIWFLCQVVEDSSQAYQELVKLRQVHNWDGGQKSGSTRELVDYGT